MAHSSLTTPNLNLDYFSGLLPTVYGIGGRADLIVPMVMAMAYGLLFAALLTLVLLPSLFMISADLKLIKIKYN